MNLKTLQTELETLDKFKQVSKDNWSIDGATIGKELVEKAVDNSSELIFKST